MEIISHLHGSEVSLDNYIWREDESGLDVRRALLHKEKYMDIFSRHETQQIMSRSEAGHMKIGSSCEPIV